MSGRDQEIIDWRRLRGVQVLGIDILECVWCGDGFVRLRMQPKPQLTCSEKCRLENRAEYHRSPGRRRGPTAPASGR